MACRIRFALNRMTGTEKACDDPTDASDLCQSNCTFIPSSRNVQFLAISARRKYGGARVDRLQRAQKLSRVSLVPAICNAYNTAVIHSNPYVQKCSLH